MNMSPVHSYRGYAQASFAKFAICVGNALRQLSSVQRVRQPNNDAQNDSPTTAHPNNKGSTRRKKGTHSETAHSPKAQRWSKDRMASFCKFTVSKAKRTPEAQHKMPTLRPSAESPEKNPTQTYQCQNTSTKNPNAEIPTWRFQCQKSNATSPMPKAQRQKKRQKPDVKRCTPRTPKARRPKPKQWSVVVGANLKTHHQEHEIETWTELGTGLD